jgi:hypothetical protein
MRNEGEKWKRAAGRFARRAADNVATLGLVAALAACSRPPAWPHPGVVTVDPALPRPGHEHACSGTVVSSSPPLVLTARHCVFDYAGQPRRLRVSYPTSGDGAARWKTVPATLERAPTAPESARGVLQAGWAWYDEDWALLRLDTADRLESVPFFEGDPASAIAPGERVDLVSCWDTGEPVLRCHSHPFAFGDSPKELIEGAHSGAAIMWHGRIVATFIGGMPDWFLLRRFWWLRRLSVTRVAGPRATLPAVTQ